jgi:Fe-S cluster biosynthesis and repair protein YggX
MQLRLMIETGFAGGTHYQTVDIDDEEIEGMSAEERNDYFDQLANEFLFEKCEPSWEIVNE